MRTRLYAREENVTGGENTSLFKNFITQIGRVVRKLIPYKSIEQVEDIQTSLSTDMTNALDRWYRLYRNEAPWLEPGKVKSLNLPALVSSEIARQVTLEMKWSITGKGKDGKTQDEDGKDIMNPRAEYLKAEFEKCVDILRQKLEQGCAAGGMIIKPYPNVQDGHLYFDWTMDWSVYPIAFDDDGNLCDVVIPDVFTEGKTTYTRLERHTVDGSNVKITHRAFMSTVPESIGREIPLTMVERWASLAPEATVTDTDGVLFGWYKVAAANNVDVDSPMGASVFCKAEDVIEEADQQWSRLLWEFEGSELAVDVDPTALRPRRNADGLMETPKLNERLFRQIDIDKGDRDLYEVFSPNIRDANLVNGLNQILYRVEDLCGLSRGTIADVNDTERTATELKINKQRSYATIADNQKALEACLRNVIRAMDKYATVYGLAPEGDYDVSFDWDDSILTDRDQQNQEMLMLLNAGIISKVEYRMWYYGETKAQAQAAIEEVRQEQAESMMSMLPDIGQANSPPPAPE